MRARSRAMVAVTFTSLALVASACGGGGTDPGTGNSGGSNSGGSSNAAGGGEITINGCTPENPLVAGNTSEVCGGNVIDAFTAKLVHYNSDTAEPEMDLAESIDTKDNQNFTVKLKPGRKFQDGTEVKAKNFVDAWNYTAYGVNGQAGSYFYAPIEGFADMQCEDEKCSKKPKADKLTGLKVVDDHTFTIKTTEKVSNLPVRLGYSAFAPQPDAFFSDEKAFEKKPIGAGPFKVDEVSSTEMKLSKFADYDGPAPAHVDKLTFRIYQDPAAAYTDVVSNNLDLVDSIPTDQLAGDLYKQDLPDRNGQKETGGIRWITFSPTDPQIKDKPELRKAISMGIDRQTIIDQVLSGNATAATGWVSPAVDGYKANACGENCTFDAAKAKAAFEKAGGYKGTFTFTVNLDGAGNKEFGEAVANQLKQNLGMDAKLATTPDFATFNKAAKAGELKGAFRNGWQMDYPSIENFLAPIYTKGADSNYARYDNKAFEKKLSEAAAADTPDKANALYQEAEAMLNEDFPTAPLWYSKSTMGWSDRVTDVKITAFGTPDLSSIRLK